MQRVYYVITDDSDKDDHVTSDQPRTDDVEDKCPSDTVSFRLLRAYRNGKRRRRRHNDTAQPQCIAAAMTSSSPAAAVAANSQNVQEEKAEVNWECSAPSRREVCVSLCKRFAAFLLSTFGLTLVTIVYSIAGGLLFAAIEAPHEITVKSSVQGSIEWHLHALWNFTAQLNVLHPTNWSKLAVKLLRNYTREVYLATKNEGWDGRMDSSHGDDNDDPDDELQWSFAGSLLFAITVITTIGYGNIAPKTAFGRFVTIPYAIVGIPLTLLTIAHIGAFMATVFRFVYRNVLCGVCCALCRRRDSHTAVNADIELNDTTNDGLLRPTENVGTARRRRTAAERVRDSYRVIVEWRRGITNALYTEDNLKVYVPLYISLLLIAGYISVGALLFGLWETDWDFLIGSYFSFITLSTIGFGDFVPGASLNAFASQEKLVLCSLYLVCGLALLAMCFDLMQEEARNMFRRWARQLGLADHR